MDAPGPATGFASIPFDAPRARTGADVWHEVKAGIDFVAHNLPRAHGLLVRVNPYPRPWRAVRLEASDGARLAAWYGPGRRDGPAVLFAPGTFQTKDDTPRKRRAIDLWRRLGANVLIMDLRGFGGSHDARGSAGYHESRDLHLAADRLLELSGRPRALLWGESLGGAVALLAGTMPEAPRRFSRIVAWSPYADLAEASAVADPNTEVGRSALGRTYRWLLRLRTGNAARDFREYLDLCAAEIGLSPQELLQLGSPILHTHELQVPGVVFHADDDDVIPSHHARRLAEARGERLEVHVLPRGGHLEFDRVAPRWYASVTQKLLEEEVA